MSRRALFLTHEPPYPPISGARLRSWHLMRELARRGWELSLFALATSERERAGSMGPLEELCEEVAVEVLPSSPAARYRRLAGALARRRAFQASYFLDPDARASLAAGGMLERADVVVVSLLYMRPYLPAQLAPRAVLDTHNSEVGRLASMTRHAPLSPRGLVARAQARLVEELERSVTQELARTLAVSEQERAWFDTIAPGRVDLVPNGVDCEGLPPRATPPADPEILFVGSMGYGANQDGVGWFAREALPLLRRPDARLTVVGGGAPQALLRTLRQAPVRVEATGFVERTDPYFARARVMVVPLRIGGGTRLKILEALARGVPVVSTTLGAEGLDLEPGRDLLIADEPVALAGAIGRLLDDDALCRDLARNGRETVEKRYDWAGIGDRMAASLARVAEAR
jgi:glycosyltransferase involved in cell wall biosynthesis